MRVCRWIRGFCIPSFDVALNTSIPSSNISRPGAYVGRQFTISISDTGDSASMVTIGTKWYGFISSDIIPIFNRAIEHVLDITFPQ